MTAGTTTKRPRGRPAGSSNRVTKPAPKTSAHRTSGRLATAVAVASNDVEEGSGSVSGQRNNKKMAATRATTEDGGTSATEKPKVGRGRPRTAPKRPTIQEPASKADGGSDGDGDGDGESGKKSGRPTADADPSSCLPTIIPKRRRGRTPTLYDTEIPETQTTEHMEIDDEREELGDLPPGASSDAVEGPAPSAIPHTSARSRRALDMDTSDVSLRRKLGELSKKHEILESKYRHLQEVGAREAERNFDRLRKQAEERAQTSKDLIWNLKTELETQVGLAKEGQSLAKTMQAQESMIASLQQKLEDLTAALSDSRAENKSLSTKLAVSRSAEATLAKVPGSAVKSQGQARGTVNSDIIQAAQMKEDLYSDLTGLIVRGVKFYDKEDIFDCLQTGRNGTLHFKLCIETDATGDGFEEAHVTYQPQLDANRDSALIDILPDYLREEITFPRPHSAKFYARVTRALTELAE